MNETKFTEAEWIALTDFRQHWPYFCDCDPFDGADTFAERMEGAGYIELRPVNKYDLDAPFAHERGIEKGGMVWDLTAKGRAALSKATGGAS